MDMNSAALSKYMSEQDRLTDLADSITAQDLSRARDDLVETFMGQPQKLAVVLDSFCDSERDSAFQLAFTFLQLLNGLPRDKGETYLTQPREVLLMEARSEAQKWLTELVSNHITEEMVQERAEESEAERRREETE